MGDIAGKFLTTLITVVIAVAVSGSVVRSAFALVILVVGFQMLRVGLAQRRRGRH